ncbi:hypothetical protein [Siminovitchia sp. 179-K 8D1 HS]|uniref:hypothetical protein n=1 Tax=Siminovitchia sp. 179-K 8D1 HS TaxID=3142385 RepID=UPI00399F375B
MGLKKIWFIWNNRTRLTINKMVCAGGDSKQNRMKLWSFAAVAAFAVITAVLFMNFFLPVLFDWTRDHLRGGTVQENVKWLSILNLLVFLSFSISGIYDHLYRFLLAEDIKFLVLSPLSLKQLFLAKILERTYIKLIFLVLVLAVFVYQLCRVFEIGIGMGFLLFAAFVSQFALAVAVRFVFISTMVIRKIFKQTLLPFALLFFSINAISAVLIIYLVYPFLNGLSEFFFYPYYLSIYESPLVQFIVELAGFTYFPHSLAVGIFPFSILFAFFAYAAMTFILFKLASKKYERLDAQHILGKMHELQSAKEGAPGKPRQFSAISLLERVPCVHPHVKSILRKDLLAFSRDEKYRWKAAFVIMSLGITGMVGAYYFLESKVDAVSAHSASAHTFLSISVLLMLMNTIVNKFSIDSEGMSFRNLVVLPVDAKHIAMAKIIGMFFVLLPVCIVFIAAAFILLRPNLFVFTVGILLSLPVILLIGLVSTATFPNFSDDSLLNLPSMRAKVMISMLSGCYLFLHVLLFYFVNSPIVFICIFIIMNVVLVIFLFHKLSQKIEEVTFRNFESLSELFD